MNIDFAYKRENCFVVFEVGYPAGYLVYQDDERYAEIEAYLQEHPEALKDEPLPPPPSDAELEAQAEAIRQSLFAEYDLAVKQHTRWIALGIDKDDSKLLAWHEYARQLELINDVEGWYKDPQWPPKPEA